jgi:hypothetical protein
MRIPLQLNVTDAAGTAIRTMQRLRTPPGDPGR